MKKLKNNQGYTLSIVLVIMIVLAIMTSTILFSITAKTKSTTSIVSSELKKIELEKVTYEYLNEVIISGSKPVSKNLDNHYINVPNSDSLIYTIEVSYHDETVLTKLEIMVEFNDTYSSYKITKWSYK